MTSHNRLLTIITRTYRGRDHFLRRAANCVNNQTYRPIEWLVIEDGPADSHQALKDIVFSGHVALKIITNDKLGRSEAANTGIKNAHGDFVCFFDDDDELFPNHAQTLVDLLNRYPQAAGAYAAALQTPVDDSNNVIAEKEKVFFIPSVGSYALLWTNLFPIQAIIFKREIIQWNQFDKNLDAWEDWLFWLSLFLERKLVWTPQITSRFFVPDGVAAERRIASHQEAHSYFNIQRSALVRERGGADIDSLKAHHQNKITELFLAVQKGQPYAVGSLNELEHGDLNQALRDQQAIKKPTKNHGGCVVFTSITLGYLPKALVLARTVKAFHPDWQFHILLNDHLPRDLLLKLEHVDEIITPAHLNIENYHGWNFGMTLVEFCCATKPFYFKHLLQKGHSHVFFIDPDIKLFSKLDYLLEELESHPVLITPHNDKPASRDSEILFTERSVLAHGLFNLGFLAAKASQESLEVIEFWRSRLVRYCADDHRNGLFNDQKWFNLVPLYYPKTKILRHEGCNVASWNISHRPLSEKYGQLFAGNDPLLFFHFSGYDAKVPKMMFDIFGAYNGVLASVLEEYDREVEINSNRFFESKFPWVYRNFDNGALVSDAMRRFYRHSLEHRVLFPKPYFTEGEDSFFVFAEKYGFDRIEKNFQIIPFG